MGKYGKMEVAVKVYKNKNSVAKATSKGGMFQSLGNAVATISFDGEVVIEKLNGMVGVSYRDQKSYDAGEGNMMINYTNSNKGDNGQYYDKVTLSYKMQAIIEVETMKSFSEGFAVPEHDSAVAAAVGMKTEDYLALAKDTINKAASLKKTAAPVSKEVKDEMKQLEMELSKDIG